MNASAVDVPSSASRATARNVSAPRRRCGGKSPCPCTGRRAAGARSRGPREARATRRSRGRARWSRAPWARRSARRRTLSPEEWWSMTRHGRSRERRSERPRAVGGRAVHDDRGGAGPGQRLTGDRGEPSGEILDLGPVEGPAESSRRTVLPSAPRSAATASCEAMQSPSGSLCPATTRTRRP